MNLPSKYWRLTALYLVVTALLLFFILRFGVKVAISLASFLQTDKTPLSGQITDNILPPPTLSALPVATNSAGLAVKGFSLVNQAVDLYLNGVVEKTVDSDSEGVFSTLLNLNLGVNELFAKARDAAGQESPASKVVSVYYTDIAPELEISQPADGSRIRQRDNRIVITGRVDEGAILTINDHMVVTQNGNFSYPTTLEEGENTIRLMATDGAGNQTPKELILTYQRR